MSSSWILRCPTCSATRPFPGVRIGAASVGKRTLAFCRTCNRLKMAKVERADAPASNGNALMLAPEEADRERTWMELLAYASEGTLTADDVEAIFNADASEARKREAAAQVASGALSASDAIRLLSLR